VAGPNLDPDFLFYWIRYSRGALEAEGTGSTFKAIRKSVLTDLAVPDIPIARQRAVSQLLHTVQRAKEATEQVIAAAHELRKSLMRHVFTYGPVAVGETESVGLKDSEVGEIPVHWDLRAMDEVVDIQRGQVDPQAEPYASMLHVGPDNIEEATGRLRANSTSKELGLISGKYLFGPGWVLYSKIRPYLRKAAIPDFTGICSADMYPLRPSSEDLDLRYLFRYLLSDGFTRQAVSHQSRTGIPKINRLQLGRVPIPVPELHSQHAISSSLDGVDLKIAAEESRREALAALFDSLLHDLMTAKLRVNESSEVA
jgi:type I restriction enzyme S subunit